MSVTARALIPLSKESHHHQYPFGAFFDDSPLDICIGVIYVDTGLGETEM